MFVEENAPPAVVAVNDSVEKAKKKRSRWRRNRKTAKKEVTTTITTPIIDETIASPTVQAVTTPSKSAKKNRRKRAKKSAQKAQARVNSTAIAKDREIIDLYLPVETGDAKLVLVDHSRKTVAVSAPADAHDENVVTVTAENIETPSENPATAENKKTKPPRTPTGTKMLINVIDAGQARVAIVGNNGRLEELYVERSGGKFVNGNIFKARVEKVEPNLHAAFIAIGSDRNAFLHSSEVVRPFGGHENILKRRRKKAPKDTESMTIDEMLSNGQELLVQISREALSSKGPSVTTHLSIPGRYLVLMPSSSTRGVSKKITKERDRNALRKELEKLSPPKDMGFIIRTAGLGKGAAELQLDLDNLTRLWKNIAEQAKKAKTPTLLYRENDLVIRAIRDHLNDNIDEIIIDNEADYERAHEFVSLILPEYVERLHLHTHQEPLFHAHGVEESINKLFDRSVRLPSGGEIIIEQTEAMVTIDVNTGRYLQASSSREMIMKINLEAANEIAHQLRLRDLGGLIMIDFIDMEKAEDRKLVEEEMRKARRKDRAKTNVLQISTLGIMEMTRQRIRQSLRRTHYRSCPYCSGSGMHKRPESLGIEFLRRLRLEMEKKNLEAIRVMFNPHTAFNINNYLREAISELEKQYSKRVFVDNDNNYALDQYSFAGANEMKKQ